MAACGNARICVQQPKELGLRIGFGTEDSRSDFTAKPQTMRADIASTKLQADIVSTKLIGLGRKKARRAMNQLQLGH